MFFYATMPNEAEHHRNCWITSIEDRCSNFANFKVALAWLCHSLRTNPQTPSESAQCVTRRKENFYWFNCSKFAQPKLRIGALFYREKMTEYSLTILNVKHFRPFEVDFFTFLFFRIFANESCAASIAFLSTCRRIVRICWRRCSSWRRWSANPSTLSCRTSGWTLATKTTSWHHTKSHHKAFLILCEWRSWSTWDSHAKRSLIRWRATNSTRWPLPTSCWPDGPTTSTPPGVSRAREAITRCGNRAAERQACRRRRRAATRPVAPAAVDQRQRTRRRIRRAEAATRPVARVPVAGAACRDQRAPPIPRQAAAPVRDGLRRNEVARAREQAPIWAAAPPPLRPQRLRLPGQVSTLFLLSNRCYSVWLKVNRLLFG